MRTTTATSRIFVRITTAGVVVAVLASCSPRGQIVMAPEAAGIGAVENVIVASARTPVTGPPYFGEGRSYGVHYASFQVSVPPDREPGTVKFPKRAPGNPATEFLVVGEEAVPDERSFIQTVNRRAAEVGTDEGFLFVHGYNTNFAEGLYRQAQMQHDLQRHGATVHFSWPSAASTLRYEHDRESALFARDELEATITAMTKSRLRGVNLVAHSMGTFVMMDTLRTMARDGDPSVFRKINSVMLISADLDIDVFRKQAPAVLAKGVPIYLIVSEGDRALKVSAFIRGDEKRLGAVRSNAELGGLDVAIVDLSAIESSDSMGHLKSATTPAVIEFINGLRASGVNIFSQGTQPGLIESSVALVQSGTNIIVAPVVSN